MSNIYFSSLHLNASILFKSHESYAFRTPGIGLFLLLFKSNSKLIYICTDLHHLRKGDYDNNLYILKVLFLKIIKLIEKIIWERADFILFNRNDDALLLTGCRVWF